MGYYTDFDMECVLKPEFVPVIQFLLHDTQWEQPSEGRWIQVAKKFPQYPVFGYYGLDDRADFIPFCGNGGRHDYALNGNVWTVYCSFKNYTDTIEKFATHILPFIAEEVKHCMAKGEDMDHFYDVFPEAVALSKPVDVTEVARTHHPGTACAIELQRSSK